jgi:acyl-coenzyme A thioesterase PaaI-like protein
MLHGGVLAALSDNAMGLSLGLMIERRLSDEALLQKTKTTGIVTTTISVDYVGMSRMGDRIVISPRVIHVGKGSGVVDALVTSNGATIARASAAFRVLSAGLKEESSAS